MSALKSQFFSTLTPLAARFMFLIIVPVFPHFYKIFKNAIKSFNWHRLLHTCIYLEVHKAQWAAPHVCHKPATGQSHFTKLYQGSSSLPWEAPLPSGAASQLAQTPYVSVKPWRHIPLILALGRQRQVGHREFKTSLDCRVSLKPARVTQGDPVRKKGGGVHADESCGYGSVGKRNSYQDWSSEFNPQNSCDKREPTSISYPLTTMWVLWCKHKWNFLKTLF